VVTRRPEHLGANQLLKNLLLRVPALFRGLARRRVTSVAEERVGPTMQVTREEVIRGFILASPRITRPRNRQPLLDLGIDVDLCQADGDAEWAASPLNLLTARGWRLKRATPTPVFS
jgi:hypothetical protein